MDKSLLAKLHDILKLTGDNKKHYCPEWCDEFNALDPELKKLLKHHCVSRYWTASHKPGCNPFPVDKEMLCIHLADVKAATISRKLRTAKYRSHKAFRIWNDVTKPDDLLQKEKDELSKHDDVLKELKEGDDLNELYEKFEKDFIGRSEDAGHCPFASLQTHNELTALWFTFFLDNFIYLGIPEVMKDSNALKRTKYAFSKKRIVIMRMRLKVNTKLSRMRDAKLIKDVPWDIKNVQRTLLL